MPYGTSTEKEKHSARTKFQYPKTHSTFEYSGEEKKHTKPSKQADSAKKKPSMCLFSMNENEIKKILEALMTYPHECRATYI